MFFVSKWRLYRMRDYTQKVQEMGSRLMAFEVETFYNYDLVKSFRHLPCLSKQVQ